MSLVVAVKHKNRIVLGADKQSSTGGNKNHTSTKIWEVPGLPGAIMGSVGSLRASQVIQYSNIIDKNCIEKEIDTDFIICSLGQVIAATLKEAGVKFEIEDEGNCPLMPNSFIFAYKDRAWMIWCDLSVSEIDDYLAIGSGSDVAKGVLFATPTKNPFERIVTCIEAAAENTLFVDDGIDLLMTETRSADKKQIIKALQLEEEIKKLEEELKEKTEDELEEKPVE